jgi:2-amino-4-hydroxy-6-hydroxymethyldihydropteridine diphosphokinase
MSISVHLGCLLLGSNIEPEKNIPLAVELLQEKLAVLKVSSVWESASVDCCYPNFLDMAVSISSDLGVAELKDQILRPLETQMGRVRTDDKNASRPIDLDIILFDGHVIDPGIWQHVHMAVPVAELFPDTIAASGEHLIDISRQLAQSTPIQIRADISISLPK